MVFEKNLFKANVSVLAKPLTVEEAIGEPGRRDFPIVEGKERILEAKFEGAKGHAFTDSAREFKGEFREILDFALNNNQNRAIYTAAMNAVLNYLNLVEETVHCKNAKPEKCAKDISEKLFKEHGNARIGLIGLNPAIADELINKFGNQNILISDLYKKNIQEGKFPVLDGRDSTEYLIENSDVIVLTGTSFVNDTFESIYKIIRQLGKEFYIYGVTAAALCRIFGFQRLCPYSTNE
ncbi:MAG: hypothetical protein H8E57_02155 [Candidatus Cloacimonetes bacterium]|nr:hypothetical protein [Candidatus Cloacimonadota bacterium]